MEKRTIFTHSTKDTLKYSKNNEYRVATFIGGNQNMQMGKTYKVKKIRDYRIGNPLNYVEAKMWIKWLYKYY